MPLLYHAYVYLEFLILACTIYILAPAATGTAISADAWKSVLTAMTSQISVTTVVGVLASVVGSAIALVFMWWGVRKLARTLMAAFRSGKLRF